MWVNPRPDFSPEKPLFLCILANTETAKIPNISAAGKSPELTDFTPAADAELVETGNAISINAAGNDAIRRPFSRSLNKSFNAAYRDPLYFY